MLITAERSLGTSKIGEPKLANLGMEGRGGVFTRKKKTINIMFFFGMLSHPPMATVSSKTLVCAFIT